MVSVQWAQAEVLVSGISLIKQLNTSEVLTKNGLDIDPDEAKMWMFRLKTQRSISVEQ